MTDEIMPDLLIDELDINEPEENEVVKESHDGSLSIGIIGAGQAGSRLAVSFFEQGYEKCITINTTDQDKTSSNYHLNIKLNENVGGAGKNMAIAQKAIEENSDSVHNLMRKVFNNVDFIIICAGLGGGTGGGITKKLISMAQNYMKTLEYENYEKRVGVIGTLPDEKESDYVKNNAIRVARDLSNKSSEFGFFMPVNNTHIFKKINSSIKPTMNKFYNYVNKTITQLFVAMNKISNFGTTYGKTLDGSDFIDVLTGGGHLGIGNVSLQDVREDNTSDLELSNSIIKSINKGYINNYFDINTANSTAICFIIGYSVMNNYHGLMEVIEKSIQNSTESTKIQKVHNGIYEDRDRDDNRDRNKIRIFVVANGMVAPEALYNRLETTV